MIYFARADGTELVKIGYTGGSPDNRISELQTGCPHKLVLLAAIEGSELDEARWHAEFAADRAQGEWFALTVRLLEAVCKAQANPPPATPFKSRRGRTSAKSSKLYAFTRDDEGRVCYAGEVADETDGAVRLEVYDGLMLWLGMLSPSGELREVPRDQCRLFNDKECFVSALGVALDRDSQPKRPALAESDEVPF